MFLCMPFNLLLRFGHLKKIDTFLRLHRLYSYSGKPCPISPVREFLDFSNLAWGHVFSRLLCVIIGWGNAPFLLTSAPLCLFVMLRSQSAGESRRGSPSFSGAPTHPRLLLLFLLVIRVRQDRNWPPEQHAKKPERWTRVPSSSSLLMRLHSAGRAQSVAGKPMDFPTRPGHLFWHCAHLGCCDLSTGFWRSHTGNVWFIHLVHITVVKSVSPWGKECLGLLFQQLATVILMVSLYSSVIWTCLQLFPEGMCSTWQLMKISFKVTSYLFLPVWTHVSLWNPVTYHYPMFILVQRMWQ